MNPERQQRPARLFEECPYRAKTLVYLFGVYAAQALHNQAGMQREYLRQPYKRILRQDTVTDVAHSERNHRNSVRNLRGHGDRNDIFTNQIEGIR